MRDYEYAFVLRVHKDNKVEVVDTLDATWKTSCHYEEILNKYGKNHYVVYAYCNRTMFGLPEVHYRARLYWHIYYDNKPIQFVYEDMNSSFFDEMRGFGRYEEFTQVFNVAKYEWLGKVQEVREELYG